MFREMRGTEKKLTESECIQILKEEPRGVLSVLGDDDYPYGVPIDHWYNPEDGCIYFHGGPVGHKLDAIRKHDRVSFCVMDPGHKEPDDWAFTVRSVIVFGRVHIVEDHEETIAITRKLSYKYTSDSDFIENEILQSSRNVVCFVLTPEHITGRRIREA